MPITIGNNIAALRSQRQLADTSRALGSTSERLSSGLRINRASDDAAGLAVSAALKSDVRVHTQAIRNLNDGVSALTMADATIESMTTIVTRIRELAQQSANDTISQKQRLAIEKEASALSNEYLRLMQTTAFNGQKLLDGSLTNGLRLQGGVGVNGSIQSDLGGKMGNGTFGTVASIATNLNSPSSIVTGDFNRDGNLDIAATILEDGAIAVRLGNGGGTFTATSNITAHDTSQSLSTGDFNGDGILDLAYTSEPDGVARVLIGNGAGGFAGKSSISLNRPTDLDVGDFNGDGRSDLVTIAKGDNAAYVFLANVDGSFETTPNFSLSKSTPIQVAAGDFNGDGLSDVALSGSDDGDIEVFLSSGAGGFVSSTTLTPVTTIQEITGDLDLADLNRDGFLDIVSTQSDGNIDAFLGRGNGSFSSSINTSDSSITGIGALGDINGDGFADLAASDGSGKYVKLFFGTGTGGFNLALSHGVNYNPTGVALGDFNNDGVLDLVNSDETSGTGKIQLSLGQTKDGVAPLLPFSLRSQAEALQAIPILDRKIQQLAAQRGVIGAFESRLSSALRAIYSRTENAAAAASRIVDADIASESASLSRLNILREAGSAVLAQANQQPALALTLLKNR